MKKLHLFLLIGFIGLGATNSFAQLPTPKCPDGQGAWYMYFWNTTIKESQWGIQGDLQHRNYDLGGDMEQIMLRGGLTFKPKNSKIKFTLGLANITSGTFGNSTTNSNETRIYQEALIKNKVSNRFQFTHRFRYEQRFLTDQDLRTRYRYNIFLNVPLNSKNIEVNTVYLAFYNELFINGQQDIGNGKTVNIFDRNRTYAALGFGLLNSLNIQLGIMRQSTTDCYKDQLQVSLHHKI